MRKIIVMALTLVFMVSTSEICFAQVREKKVELEKIKVYIKVLDQKIDNARKAKLTIKVKEMIKEKQKQLDRAKALENEITRLEKTTVTKVSVVTPERTAGFLAGAGFGGGAGIVKIGYLLPLMEGLDVAFGVGYGMGNGYSVPVGDAAAIIPFRNYFAGLSLGAASYSQKVENIAGLGVVDKGTKFGIGVFGGTMLGPTRVQLGYDSALGLTAGAIYKF